MQTRFVLDEYFNAGVKMLAHFWNEHICVEAQFLPEGALRETTQESAAHYFLIKIQSKAQNILFGSSGNDFQKFRFSAKMTSMAGQKPGNSPHNLCWILNWIHLF